MPGLLLILTDTRGERFEAALELAATAAALGRPVAVLLRGAAVQAADACAVLLELGATVSVCQTAMAAQGLEAAALPANVEPGGMVGFLAGRADWQLAVV
jgi:intracellular sulfur oxidation DsrE/DsrF family protein